RTPQLRSWPADRSEDLARRGLLVERLLRLVEEADVLDRDRGLIGEGLHEIDLSLRERADRLAADDEATDRPSLTQQRDGKHRPCARRSDESRPFPELAVRLDVLDVQRPQLANQTSHHRSRIDDTHRADLLPLRSHAGLVEGGAKVRPDPVDALA